MKILETKRLIIRRYKRTDFDSVHAIFSDPVTMAFWPSPFTSQQTEAWIERCLRDYKSLGFGRWAVVLKEDNRVIGDCGIMVTDIDGQREHDLGYIIHHPYWNKGIATEAAEACKNYGMNTLHLKRLCANMPVNHIASSKVAQKIGMKREKVFLNKRNREIETYLYTIIE